MNESPLLHNKLIQELLKLIESQKIDELEKFVNQHNENIIYSLFKDTIIYNYLTSENYKDNKQLYQFYPDFIKKDKTILKYYFTKSTTFPNLPLEYKNDPVVIEHFLKLDPLNYIKLTHYQKSKLKYIEIVALEFKKLYEKREYDKFDIMGVTYEERYFYRKIPKGIKKLLNIEKRNYTNTDYLYKEILKNIESIKEYKILSKELNVKKNNFKYKNTNKI